MPTITSFRQLLVWQKSMDLAVRCYDVARKFPKTEQPVLGYQIRKSAVSMPSNVAEGFSRHSTPFYIQHLWIAHASGAELETQLELGKRIQIVTEPEAEGLIANAQEVARMDQWTRALTQPIGTMLDWGPDARTLRPRDSYGLASLQLSAIPTSTVRGTVSVTALSICCRTTSATVSASS